MNKYKHLVSLGALLAIVWLLLSGHYTYLLLGLGLLTVSLVVYLADRMDVADHEGHPMHLNFSRLIRYWVWLLREIIKSNIEVCRIIIHPALPITPTVFAVKSTQETDLGRVIYANSITLTPGTVSIDVEGNITEVHALTKPTAENLKQGVMDRKVTELEVYN